MDPFAATMMSHAERVTLPVAVMAAAMVRETPGQEYVPVDQEMGEVRVREEVQATRGAKAGVDVELKV